MSRIAVFFAKGYEEIEALTVVDICRRCGIVTEMVSVSEEMLAEGAHGITVQMDKTFSEADFDAYDMLVLPGGGDGTKNLEAQQELMARVDEFYKAGKYVAAICAAPSILGHRGILKGRRACCYPGFESQLEGAEVTFARVESDGNVITSRGMGTAVDFGLSIVGALVGQDKAKQLAEAIIYEEAEKER